MRWSSHEARAPEEGACAGYSVSVLRDLTLEARPELHGCILGPNGAGKTTLLKAIAGRSARGGTLRLDGEGNRTRRQPGRRTRGIALVAVKAGSCFRR